MATFAKTFDVDVSSGRPAASNEAYYHGETIEFRVVRGKAAVTNVEYASIYYTTNSTAEIAARKAGWWRTDGLVFHPTNDCGASSYRFFVEGRDALGRDWHANGLLRLLDSPGFTPNALPLPAKAIDFAEVETRNAPWARIAEVEGIASNAAVEATAPLYRPFGDEYVYESLGMGDFSWSSERADVLAALGSSQPYVSYEDGDMREYALELSVGPTNYWGYAWASAVAPVVEFWLDGYFWDPDAGEEFYDAAVVVGRRTPQGYDRANPVDTFARQSALSSLRSEFSSLRSLLVGETKVMRTGREGQLGTGWGFVRHSMTGETRLWRIRVPQWTAVSGMTTNNMSAGNAYYDARQRADSAPHSVSQPVILSNILSFYPQWDLRRSLRETRGVHGADAVAMADWNVGLFLESTNGARRCVANFVVRQTSASPMSYSVTPSAAGMMPFEVPGSGAWLRRDLDLPPITRSWKISYRDVTVTAVVKAVMLEPTAASSGDGTFSMKFWTVSDQVIDSPANGLHLELADVKVPHAVTVTCASPSNLESVYAPYYRLVSSLDSSLHYDPAADVTYRVSCTNGVYYSEWYMDGDWRKEDL